MGKKHPGNIPQRKASRPVDNEAARQIIKFNEATLAPSLQKTGAFADKSLIVWLRGSGVGAILIGTLGLMQAFFWPSIFCFYVGAVLLFIDLFHEKGTRHQWAKYATATVLVAVMAIFTYDVVLRRNPISAFYVVEDGKLRVHITNESIDDYHEVDLQLGPQMLHAMIDHAEHTDGLIGVDIVPSAAGGRFTGAKFVGTDDE